MVIAIYSASYMISLASERVVAEYQVQRIVGMFSTGPDAYASILHRSWHERCMSIGYGNATIVRKRPMFLPQRSAKNQRFDS